MVSFGRFLLIVILTIVVIVFSVNPQSAPIVPDLTGMKPWSSALGYLRKQEGSIGCRAKRSGNMLVGQELQHRSILARQLRQI